MHVFEALSSTSCVESMIHDVSVLTCSAKHKLGALENWTTYTERKNTGKRTCTLCSPSSSRGGYTFSGQIAHFACNCRLLRVMNLCCGRRFCLKILNSILHSCPPLGISASQNEQNVLGLSTKWNLRNSLYYLCSKTEQTVRQGCAAGTNCI